MRYLLDTNVISELQNAKGDDLVKMRFRRLDAETLFVSAVVVGELQKGIRRLPDGRKKHDLESWFNDFTLEYNNRILPFDVDTAQIWGDLVAKFEREGRPISFADGQIAATAIQHGLVLITRNTKDFKNTGTRLWNIWETDAAFI